MAKLAGTLKTRHLYAFSRFNMLWICPPLVITRAELQFGLDVVEESLRAVDETLRGQSAAA
jgi:taurine--2-oxoglutarate transaminase